MNLHYLNPHYCFILILELGVVQEMDGETAGKWLEKYKC